MLKTAKLKAGFTLIEIVLSMFVVLAIITILLTASATYNTSRRSNLQVTAGKIAARQIETLRKTAFASLPANGPPSTFTDADLSKLPSGTANQTFSDYQIGQPIKLVQISVAWVEGGIAKSIKMDTLIYQNGI